MLSLIGTLAQLLFTRSLLHISGRALKRFLLRVVSAHIFVRRFRCDALQNLVLVLVRVRAQTAAEVIVVEV
jgi:hypothetical protein